MSKMCLVYNYAQLYRAPIFTEMDREWDCTWFFGKNTTDIKGMDITRLNNATEVENKRIKGAWFYQKGTCKLARKKDIDTFLLLGDPHCLSVWYIALWHKFFGRKRQRLYYWTHGWYGKEGKATKVIKKLFFKLADGVFLYGNHAKKLMIEEGFDASKLYVIHNSLDYKKQLGLRETLKESDIYSSHFGNTNRTIIFIGRLTAVKRLDMLLDAMNILKQQGRNYNLVFVGNGEKREDLEARTKHLGLDNNVWFYGACYDEAENANLIYNADLCVAPGNVGLTAMHTMVFGTPVISHDDFKWQMPEFEAIKPGETGDFFKAGDINSLAQTIDNWFVNHTDREAVRRACHKEIDTEWTPDFQMNVFRKILNHN